uniref:CBU-0592-like domain-containing protein n=1 Tax=Tetraselmis chuii TaxID=63592 RepID=A0A7S1T913_9CHLO|mmetsp:Transcript_8640/g.15622  ORF Transcript_8640/g.15622 Transcript_8640/m.15622 type:complete len:167 (+) Transcript_8640:112-612(+)
MGEIIPDALQPRPALEVVSFIVGSAGALLILGAYVALLRGAMREHDRGYHALNALGGLLAAIGALVEALTGSFGSCPLVFLEGVWGAVAARELLLTYTNPKKHTTENNEETDGAGDDEEDGQLTDHVVVPRMFSGSRSSKSQNSTPYGSVTSHDGGQITAALLRQH